jgi:hypothetical protein
VPAISRTAQPGATAGSTVTSTRSIRELDASAAGIGRSLAASRVTRCGPTPGRLGSATTAWNGFTVTLPVPSVTRPG